MELRSTRKLSPNALSKASSSATTSDVAKLERKLADFGLALNNGRKLSFRGLGASPSAPNADSYLKFSPMEHSTPAVGFPVFRKSFEKEDKNATILNKKGQNCNPVVESVFSPLEAQNSSVGLQSSISSVVSDKIRDSPVEEYKKYASKIPSQMMEKCVSMPENSNKTEIFRRKSVNDCSNDNYNGCMKMNGSKKIGNGTYETKIDTGIVQDIKNDIRLEIGEKSINDKSISPKSNFPQPEFLRTIVEDCLEEFEEKFLRKFYQFYSGILWNLQEQSDKMDQILKQTSVVEKLTKENERLKTENEKLKALRFGH